MIELKTQQQRFLNIAFQRFGEYQRVADLLGVSRQFIHAALKKGNFPLKYASFIGRKQNFHTGLFRYKEYVLVERDDALTYEDLLKGAGLDIQELLYISGGIPERHPTKILEAVYKSIRRQR